MFARPSPGFRQISLDEPRSSQPPHSPASRSVLDWVDSMWPADQERRRRQRFRLALQGRYMLDDGSEFPCATEDVSAVGVAVRGFPAGAIGEWVIACFDQLGWIEGVVVRRTPVGFALDIRASPRKLARLADKVSRLAPRESRPPELLDRSPVIRRGDDPAKT